VRQGRRVRQGSEDALNTSLNDFHVMCRLGHGGFGTVMLVRKKTSHALYAMKMMSKHRMRAGFAENVISECEAMQALRHPFIVRLYGAFHDAARVCFLLEVGAARDRLVVRVSPRGRGREDRRSAERERLGLLVTHISPI
jgi:serine/threonine protein kinase